MSTILDRPPTEAENTSELASSSLPTTPTTPSDDNDASHARDEKVGSSRKSLGTAVDAVVIQPRGLALPPLHIPKQVSMPIPSLETTKVGPQNFEKIRILGAGATGRVYLVKSIVSLLPLA